ncbi:MAG TPA: RNA-binding protein [Acidimicrobiia bacterium]|nr:RNA-binding protein [Acidimicrobiia bacterium]
MKLYVGNLPFSTSSEDLSRLFAAHGAVESAEVVTDRDTGRSRGFGFVEMGDDDARRAIEELDGSDIAGRRLTVNEARPRQPRGGGGGDRDRGDRGPRRDGGYRR